ncbi:hypothetical protein [Streptomyces sp. NPDC058579]
MADGIHVRAVAELAQHVRTESGDRWPRLPDEEYIAAREHTDQTS